MTLPPLFDCDVWTGESAEHPTGGIDSPSALLTEMDRVGIDRALVYHITARSENSGAGNDRLLEEIEDSPRLTPCWVASPSVVSEYESAEAFVETMQDENVDAVRLFPGEHDYRLVDEHVEPLLEAVADAGVVLLLDRLSARSTDGFTYAELGQVCSTHPDMPVILTQLIPSMGEFSNMEAMVEQVERTDNLHISTDRFQTHRGLRQFVDRCGIDRLLFGTHVPHAAAGAGIATVMISSLTPEERRRVTSENLGRLLGEPPAAWNEDQRGPTRELDTVPYDIVDLHGHVRMETGDGENYPNATGVVSEMDRTGIGLACVHEPRHGPECNDFIADVTEQYPDRLVPVATANPTWNDVEGELERAFDELGMECIKIHPAQHDVPAGDERYDPVWTFANEREALVVTHGLLTDDEREAFTRVASEHPDMTLMLYHAGRSWDRVDNFVAVAEACPNVLLEITFSYNVDGIIEYLIDRVGPERVFFGTDIGARAPQSQVGWATYARISDADRRKLMRENGLRLLDEHDVLPEAVDSPGST